MLNEAALESPVRLAAAASPLRLALAGGGTGGHLVPGLHVLAHLAKGRTLGDLVWLTSGRGVEDAVLKDLARRAGGAPVERVALALEPPGGGAPSLSRLSIRLPPSVLRARAALAAHQVEVVLGLGGFACAPAVIAARTLRIPVCLLEINAAAGRATRTLGPLCARVLHAWPTTCPRAAGHRHVLTGPPLPPGFGPRDRSIEALARAKQDQGFDPARPLVVVFGGSQGAAALNEFVRVHASALLGRGVQVLHQVGPGRLEESDAEQGGLRAVEYVDDVRGALEAADVVLCRGGASTVAEVGAAAVPAWVVPYPHHPDHHQELNARQLGEGARIVQESSLSLTTAVALARLAGAEGAGERERMADALEGAVPTGGARRVIDELVGVRRVRL